MRARAPGLATALALAATTASAQPAAPPPDDNYEYDCRATHSAPYGTMMMNLRVSQGGSLISYYGEWRSVRGPGGLAMSFETLNPDRGDVADNSTITFAFEKRWRGNPRFVIRLSRGGYLLGGTDRLRFQNDFARAPLGLRAFLPLLELRAYAGSVPVMVEVVDRRERVLARDRLDPAMLEAALAAPRAVRAEVEAMAADHRNRCQRLEPSGDADIMI